MAEINDTQNQNLQNNDGFRRMKKVKRPVKRFNPSAPNSNFQQQSYPSDNQSNNMAAQPLNPQANLDELLDSQLNLPATPTLSGMPLQQETGQRLVENNTYQQPDHFLTDDDFVPKPRLIDTLMEGNLFTAKGVAVIGVLAFVLALLIAQLFMGGKTVVKDGLQGVVVNAEVPRGRARCGVAERTQGCVLYIMNPQRRDLQGRDFYDLASQLTGRQRFVVETGNMRYSSVKIRPGDIAQINIPPLQ